MSSSIFNILSACIFALAVLHTFCVPFFARLEQRYPKHSGLFHLLGEVEVVFGVWAIVLLVLMFLMDGRVPMIHYLESRDYTEPFFVFVVMVIAGSRPILFLAGQLVRIVSLALPLDQRHAYFFVTLCLVPLLGSLITEPAAMTLAAFLLRDRFYSQGMGSRLMYATLGVLFVNISIGGTLTPYAAPPVLMVAEKWGFDLWFMLDTFGWKAALAVFFNALGLTLFYGKELQALPAVPSESSSYPPVWVLFLHVSCLIGVVVFAHHLIVFVAIFLFFLAQAHAYPMYQDRLVIKEGLLVGVFLAGLVVLGGVQAWWLQDLLSHLSPSLLYFGAIVLTAVTDNAAITYMGSLVEGVGPQFKYALVSGAVTGGGLTVIANAPNPAGCAILKSYFHANTIRASGLFLAAIPPTLIAIAAFQCL